LVGRREQRRQAIRAALVEAAGELFDEVGYAAATTAAIAARASVAQATLFRHFDTKADLALVHLHDVVDRMVSDVEARPRRETPYAAVVAAVKAPGIVELFTSPEVRAEGERIASHQELAAHVYWMISDVRERLTVDFATRLGLDPGSACPRVLAGVVVECATYSMEASLAGRERPGQILLGALAAMRPLLDPRPFSADAS
jgi:AcrR family transcriptional regulator